MYQYWRMCGLRWVSWELQDGSTGLPAYGYDVVVPWPCERQGCGAEVVDDHGRPVGLPNQAPNGLSQSLN